MELLDLPKELAELLEILKQLKIVWPNLKINQELILFGAATHDIGKTEITDELFESGKKHELAGTLINSDFNCKFI